MISGIDMRVGVESKVYCPSFIYTQKITAYVGAIPLSSAYPPLYPECVTLLPQHGFWTLGSIVINPYISVSKTLWGSFVPNTTFWTSLTRLISEYQRGW